ncbi:MAG: GntR family transcriptional regulator [Hamadaea sp.]|nr:GntR family transcriptional regulator [Hamadaea sp.]
MIVEVDTGSPVPAYEQIRAQIAAMIDSGGLPPGQRLPPVRQLAADLGLAVNTAARAYRELESAGLVVSRVRHGTVVADRPRLTSAQVSARLAEAAREYATAARLLGVPVEQARRAVEAAFDG